MPGNSAIRKYVVERLGLRVFLKCLISKRFLLHDNVDAEESQVFPFSSQLRHLIFFRNQSSSIPFKEKRDMLIQISVENKDVEEAWKKISCYQIESTKVYPPTSHSYIGQLV
jgi:hypothetical protein